MARQATTNRKEHTIGYVTDWMEEAGAARGKEDKSGDAGLFCQDKESKEGWEGVYPNVHDRTERRSVRRIGERRQVR